MDNIRSETEYGALLQHLQGFSHYPDAKAEGGEKAKDAPIPEAAYTLAGMVLEGYTPHPSRR